jgi:SpoVK/Ycf46/Vps4 family AAA+-type ATPase
MIADLWHLPLLRLDVGALFGSLVGESEERTRRALSLAETIAPCILWVDEIEKAFAFGSGDAGTSQRVFAHLLTWMQDKTAPCFVVATANNIAALPPELLRKGRFDEIFFLDLPSLEERREIFSVHLKKRKCIPAEFDLETLAHKSEGYVGAEIEQTVIDAMYLAFNENMRRVTTNDILTCIKTQVPLSVSQRETVAALREWLAEGRAISASLAVPAAVYKGRGPALETFDSSQP